MFWRALPMIKRLMTLYIALHLAFGPAVNAFASGCAMPDQANLHQECDHHQKASTQAADRHGQSHDINCHDSGSGKKAPSRCDCDCPASTVGLITTVSPPLADNPVVPFASAVQTQHSVTDTQLYKPPRS
jgi:hypothetical protein